jgi:competence protein ComEC
MNNNPFSLKQILPALMFSLAILFFFSIHLFFNSSTKIVFCDVGQGDASYIRVKNRIDVLVDTGPDKKVLTCLGRHMPFYDRKIELIIISHPQKDHYYGLTYLLDRYTIDTILMSPLGSSNQTFNKMQEKIKENKIKLFFPKAGTKTKVGDDSITFFWPKKEFLARHLILDKYNPHVLGLSSLYDNYFSLIFSYEEDDFRVLFTGDAPPDVLNGLIEEYNLKTNILKVPHHGSKNGATREFLSLADPMIAVISAGKNNSYGHPHKEVIEMLQALKINIRRTDEEGDVIFSIKTR